MEAVIDSDITIEAGDELEFEASAEFQSILEQAVMQRCGDAIETLERAFDPEVQAKAEQSAPDLVREARLDIAVALHAFRALIDFRRSEA